KGGQEVAVSVAEPAGNPCIHSTALGRGDSVAIAVAADVVRVRQRSQQLQRLARERAADEVAAEDDRVRLLSLDVAEHRVERGRIPVDVGDRRDSHYASRAARILSFGASVIAPPCATQRIENGSSRSFSTLRRASAVSCAYSSGTSTRSPSDMRSSGSGTNAIP